MVTCKLKGVTATAHWMLFYYALQFIAVAKSNYFFDVSTLEDTSFSAGVLSTKFESITANNSLKFLSDN